MSEEIVVRLSREELREAAAAVIATNGIGRSSAFPPRTEALSVERKLRTALSTPAEEQE